MRRTIHINLLKNSEKRSSMPVRIRVMVPTISSLILLCLVVWGWLLSSKVSDLAFGRDDIRSKQENQKSAIADYTAIKMREGMIRSEVEQLESYRGSRIMFSEVLATIPHAVPSTMQLTRLDLIVTPRPISPKPETPSRDSGKKDAGKKTESDAGPWVEKVFLKLGGFVDSAASVDALRTALVSGDFTNLVVRTEIPKGAFKISGDKSNKFLFEVNCDCIERVFK